MNNERLKTLLYNAISMLEEQYYIIDEADEEIIVSSILDELGMEEEEYDEIMGE